MKQWLVPVSLVLTILMTGNALASDTATSDIAERDELSLTMGGFHSCALLSSEVVTCWGSNDRGQTSPPRLKVPRQLSAGEAHTCALDEEGVKCWGWNDDGQTDVPPLRNPHMISAGGWQSCAIDDDGVKCWGWNRDGEPPPRLIRPHAISVGGWHACAIDDEGVKCWGWNKVGQASVPRGLRNPRIVSAGTFHTCALDDDGVKCWGLSKDGLTAVPKLVHPRALSAGGDRTCAIDEEGVKCWPEKADYGAPSLRNPLQISSGWKHSCALAAEGVRCWGNDEHGVTSVPTFPSMGLIVPFSFTLNGFDQYLANISHSYYHQKADFIRKVVVEAKLRENRLFLANSLKPLLEETPSVRGDEIRAGFTRSLARYNTAAKVSALRDFAPSPELTRSSLRLSVEAVRVLERQLGVGRNAVPLAPFSASLGRALAASDPRLALEEVLGEWAKVSPRMETALANRMSRPFALILASQMEYLQRVR